MNDSGFQVYIDESGDEGFSFGAGSSDWFVVAAVIARTDTDLRSMSLVDEIRRLLLRPAKRALHFRDLDHEERLPYLDAIVQAGLLLVATALHKPSLSSPKRSDHGSLYVRQTRRLLQAVEKRIVGLAEGGKPPVQVAFSNRQALSTARLQLGIPELLDPQSTHGLLDASRFQSLTHGRRMGLQVADAVAGSVF
ncbi:MAG: DUF3800 domain-containing protein [bacterium]